MPIENVSDTARWVAVYRAMETKRRDAIFRDPFAERLAGEKGQQIVASRKQNAAWAMIVRTAVFDEIILRAVDPRHGGAGVLLNLAAGLDARPWRLPLPPDLKWIDVDLPGILDYKVDRMANERTACRYEAVRLDLRDAAKRQALFAQVARDAERVFVVAEGLLIYLTAEDVGALARDLHAQPNFAQWLIDLASPQLLEWMSKSGSSPEAAPFQFAPEEGTKFFEPFGWREKYYRSTMFEARRLKRQPRGMWFWRIVSRLAPAKQRAEVRERWRRMSAYVVLERT